MSLEWNFSTYFCYLIFILFFNLCLFLHNHGHGAGKTSLRRSTGFVKDMFLDEGSLKGTELI
jgi:hypothetical protein